MDWIITVFVIPEILVLVIGFIAIIVSLVYGGELDKLKPMFRPKGREVDASYWGQYVLEHKQPNATVSGIALPKIQKEPEPVKWEIDWTGAPPPP